jgi:hypothetical protein
MKFAKSILAGTGAVVLAGLILALLAPKAAHAIAATAVQVENTTATPVPTQGMLPGIPFTQTCHVSGAATYCILDPASPPGATFHATMQSTLLEFSSIPSNPPTIQYTFQTNGITINAIDNLVKSGSSSAFFLLTTDHDFYVDAGQESICVTAGGSSSISCTLTGYLTH